MATHATRLNHADDSSPIQPHNVFNVKGMRKHVHWLYVLSIVTQDGKLSQVSSERLRVARYIDDRWCSDRNHLLHRSIRQSISRGIDDDQVNGIMASLMEPPQNVRRITSMEERIFDRIIARILSCIFYSLRIQLDPNDLTSTLSQR